MQMHYFNSLFCILDFEWLSVLNVTEFKVKIGNHSAQY